MPKVDVYLVDTDGGRFPYAAPVEMEVGEDGLPPRTVELTFHVVGLLDNGVSGVNCVAYEFGGETVVVNLNYPGMVIFNGDEAKVTLRVSVSMRCGAKEADIEKGSPLMLKSGNSPLLQLLRPTGPPERPA